MGDRPPMVAVLVGREPDERFSVHRGYLDGLWAAGATPVLVPAGPDPTHGAGLDLVDRADALLVTGGGDVDPRTYGDEEREALMSVDDARDRIELAAVHVAHSQGKRVLGICRGAQLVAVAFGAALHQDLGAAGFAQHHWEEERQYEPVHGLDVEPGSLAELVLAGATKVNSIHHQAVQDAGALRVTARSDDGVIEAVEGDGVLGVQWHPERLLHFDPRQVAAFEWLAGTT
jgi:putative glutamine amidotransferase